MSFTVNWLTLVLEKRLKKTCYILNICMYRLGSALLWTIFGGLVEPNLEWWTLDKHGLEIAILMMLTKG